MQLTEKQLRQIIQDTLHEAAWDDTHFRLKNKLRRAELFQILARLADKAMASGISEQEFVELARKAFLDVE